MSRLRYTRYVAHCGDVGAAVTDTMAIQAPAELAGIHLNFLRRPPPEVAAALLGRAPVPVGLTEKEHAALDAFGARARKGYIAEQGQSPQTIGYSLTDTPAGLAAWMLDHDTDSYLKILPSLYWRGARGWPDPGGHSRQHHALLADEYRRLGGADVLGERARYRRGDRASGT